MEYTIANGQTSVTLTTLGGTFSSIRDASGTERLWQPDPEVWTGQAPICFPICGGLRDGRATTLSGAKVELPRHGFARKHEFALAGKGEDHVELALESDEGTLAQYPFPFRLVAGYALDGSRILVSYSVTNTGDEPMPFFVGGHPAFRVPLREGERYSDYSIEFERPETCDVPTPVVETGLIDESRRMAGPQDGSSLPLSHELFSVAETIYDGLESRSAELRDGTGEATLRISFPDLPYLVVWGKPKGDFVAIEPWGGLSTCSDEDDVLEHKRGCLVARPGETVTRGFAIELL
jgi:galactose mutarotase-like enzyme